MPLSVLAEYCSTAISAVFDTAPGECLEVSTGGDFADSTRGSRGPSAGSTAAGAAGSAGPGAGNPPGDGGPGDGGPGDSRRKKSMYRDTAEAALIDAAANYGKVGTATGLINTAVGGATALAEGINIVHENQGRGLGGSSKGGRAAMDAALAEMPQARPATGK